MIFPPLNHHTHYDRSHDLDDFYAYQEAKKRELFRQALNPQELDKIRKRDFTLGESYKIEPSLFSEDLTLISPAERKEDLKTEHTPTELVQAALDVLNKYMKLGLLPACFSANKRKCKSLITKIQFMQTRFSGSSDGNVLSNLRDFISQTFKESKDYNFRKMLAEAYRSSGLPKENDLSLLLENQAKIKKVFEALNVYNRKIDIRSSPQIFYCGALVVSLKEIPLDDIKGAQILLLSVLEKSDVATTDERLKETLLTAAKDLDICPKRVQNTLDKAFSKFKDEVFANP